MLMHHVLQIVLIVADMSVLWCTAVIAAETFAGLAWLWLTHAPRCSRYVQ